MNVLVTESAPGEADVLVRALIRRGHVVHTCASSVGAACVGLEPGGVCPLDALRFDLMIDVRRAGHHRLTVHEYGALCALRQDLPVVVAGPPGAGRAAPWSVATVDPTDIEAIEAIAADPERLTAVEVPPPLEDEA